MRQLVGTHFVSVLWYCGVYTVCYTCRGLVTFPDLEWESERRCSWTVLHKLTPRQNVWEYSNKICGLDKLLPSPPQNLLYLAWWRGWSPKLKKLKRQVGKYQKQDQKKERINSFKKLKPKNFARMKVNSKISFFPGHPVCPESCTKAPPGPLFTKALLQILCLNNPTNTNRIPTYKENLSTLVKIDSMKSESYGFISAEYTSHAFQNSCKLK